jgi:signal recognition particle subunit SRP54
MFESLSNKLASIFDKLKGRGVLNEGDINVALREIRIALLEADVAVAAAKHVLERVRERALGQEVLKSITPGQMVIKFVYEELVSFLGEEPAPLNTKANSPFSFMLVGLQGSGKTTSAAKLANILKNTHKVLLASLDVYRPAAREQLKVLANSIGVDCLEIIADETPAEIVERAMARARKLSVDTVLFDTAGRTHIDEAMMAEVANLQKLIKPLETLLVADSMTGQDAVNIAKSFNDKISLTGLILTRADGDARGGAALSMRYITQCPIKFLGIGERLDQFIPFHPQRIVDSILDKGDMLGLYEKISKLEDHTEFEQRSKRLERGKFNLDDMLYGFEKIMSMGGAEHILKMLPGGQGMIKKMDAAPSEKASDHDVRKQMALMRSMTAKERKNPDILDASRRKRIAAGAGQTVADVNSLLKKFQLASGFMKRFSSDKKDKKGKKLFGPSKRRRAF